MLTYNDAAKRQQFWTSWVTASPLFRAWSRARIMQGLPPERVANMNDTAIENFVQRPGGPNQNVAFYQIVGDRFFETMRVKLIEGRFFDAATAPAPRRASS